jgi:glycerol-1-phosphate dehydrogenase [NAD(P)+]
MSGRPPREVEIPRLLHVGSGCLHDVARLLDDHGFDLGRVLVGSGPGPSRVLAEGVVAELTAAGVDVLHHSRLHGRLDEAAALASEIIEEGVTVAVAVGGGRVIDTVKLAAARTCVEFVSVPTAISNDGISSPVASLVGRDGSRTSHAARMPCGIVMDVATIVSAPRRTLRAGLGDLVSNLTACLDWRLADARGAEHFDAFSALIAESAARPGLDLRSVDTAAEQEVLAHGLLLSGLAMAAAGTSRPCSGAEHLISHALDRRLGPAAALHGEQVALGTLVSATAHSSPLLAPLRELFVRIGLPTRPEDVGIDRGAFVDAVAAAPEVKPERWTILTEHAGDAADLVDAAFPEPRPAMRLVAG